jgi:hypothetical protein
MRLKCEIHSRKLKLIVGSRNKNKENYRKGTCKQSQKSKLVKRCCEFKNPHKTYMIKSKRKRYQNGKNKCKIRDRRIWKLE